MSRQPHYGISLLDVVVAIALAAILSALIFQALQQTRHAVKKIQATVDVNSMLIHFKDRFFKDIQGTFIPQTPPKKQTQTQSTQQQPQQATPQQDASQKELFNYFVLERININEKSEADHGKLNFITTSSLIIYDAVAPRAVRILYELKKDPDKKSWQLFRSESAELDYKKFAESFKNKTGLMVLTNIESLEITCYAPQPKEKGSPQVPQSTVGQLQKKEEVKEPLVELKTWNSDERKQEKKPVLPEFIQIKGSIHAENSKTPIDFLCMVPIESIPGNGQASVMDQFADFLLDLQGNASDKQKSSTGTPSPSSNSTPSPRSS